MIFGFGGTAGWGVRETVVCGSPASGGAGEVAGVMRDAAIAGRTAVVGEALLFVPFATSAGTARGGNATYSPAMTTAPLTMAPPRPTSVMTNGFCALLRSLFLR